MGSFIKKIETLLHHNVRRVTSKQTQKTQFNEMSPVNCAYRVMRSVG